MIDGMIMSWHLEGRDLQRQKLQEKQMGRLELMDKSCQVQPAPAGS